MNLDDTQSKFLGPSALKRRAEMSVSVRLFSRAASPAGVVAPWLVSLVVS